MGRYWSLVGGLDILVALGLGLACCQGQCGPPAQAAAVDGADCPGAVCSHDELGVYDCSCPER